MNRFTVDTTALRQHAAEVRRIAEDVSQAADAATEVGIGGVDIYGALCSALIVPALHGFFGDAVDLAKKASDFTSSYAEGLEANSDVYDEVDQSVVETLNAVRSELFQEAAINVVEPHRRRVGGAVSDRGHRPDRRHRQPHGRQRPVGLHGRRCQHWP